jgi:hypothetical protein
MTPYLKLTDLTDYLKFLIALIKKNFIKITLIGIATGVLAILVVTFQKPVYKAKLSFLLNENDPGMSFNISSLAGLAGLSGLGGGVNISEDKLVFLANSRSLIGSTLLCRAYIDGQNDILANHYIRKFKLHKGFKKDTVLKNFEGFVNDKMNKLSYQENKAIDLIIKQITDQKKYSIEVKKKAGIVAQWAGIVSLEFKDVNEQIAKVFIDTLYGKLSEYYTQKSIGRQLRTYNLIKHRADSIKALLTDAENRGALLADENIKLFKMQGRLEIERSKRDVEMLTLMYAEVIKNLEMAKFNLDNQTPVFQIVDAPTYPLYYKKTSKSLAGIAGAFFGSLAFVIYLSLTYKRT